MAEYTERTTRISHGAEGKDLNHESTIHVEIVDYGAGEFVRIRGTDSEDYVDLNPEEWPTLQAAISRMVSACRRA